MGDGALDRLILAENEAMEMVKKAHAQARAIIDEAENSARKERERRLNDFHTHRAEVIRSSGEDARTIAERIRNDGVELAHGLEGRLKSIIPRAVNDVMEMLHEGQWG